MRLLGCRCRRSCTSHVGACGMCHASCIMRGLRGLRGGTCRCLRRAEARLSARVRPLPAKPRLSRTSSPPTHLRRCARRRRLQAPPQGRSAPPPPWAPRARRPPGGGCAAVGVTPNTMQAYCHGTAWASPLDFSYRRGNCTHLESPAHQHRPPAWPLGPTRQRRGSGQTGGHGLRCAASACFVAAA